MPSGDPVPARVHCPFCAHDISFMKDAFGRATFGVYVAPTTTSTVPVETAVKLNDAVYSRDLQTLLWQRMQDKAALWAAMPQREMIASACAQKRSNREDGSVVMHLMFAKDITPIGGLVHKAVTGMTATQPSQPPDLSREALLLRGYSVVEGDDGPRVQAVDDVPVGPLWNTLQYWGGERQHRRWHMARPVNASPHRNNCPAFMDGRMCALQVWFTDDERLADALQDLCDECEVGVNGSPAAGTIQAIMLA